MPGLNHRGTVRTLATMTALVLGIMLATPAVAKDKCSIRTIAGKWVFATETGHMLSPVGGPGPHGRITDVTAMGTMNIDKAGNISGDFDISILGVAFIPDIPYTGLVTVNPDCTGSLNFSPASSTNTRTDSIVISGNGNEISAMVGFITLAIDGTRDFGVSWTYKIRRAGGGK